MECVKESGWWCEEPCRFDAFAAIFSIVELCHLCSPLLALDKYLVCEALKQITGPQKV